MTFLIYIVCTFLFKIFFLIYYIYLFVRYLFIYLTFVCCLLVKLVFVFSILLDIWTIISAELRKYWSCMGSIEIWSEALSIRLLMLKLTFDPFPLSWPAGEDNGFHDGPRGPVTLGPSVRWLHGRLMATCHSSSASITRVRRRVCPCLLVCHALRWSAFHYALSGSDPRRSSLPRTCIPTHNTHISENRPAYGFPSDMLVCFGTKQSYMLSQWDNEKNNALEAIRCNFGVYYTGTQNIWGYMFHPIQLSLVRTCAVSKCLCFQSLQRNPGSKPFLLTEAYGLSRLAFTSAKLCSMRDASYTMPCAIDWA